MGSNNWGTAAQEQVQTLGRIRVYGDCDCVWKTQINSDSRMRIVHKITEYLKRHLPFCGQEGLHELKKIAIRFEERMFTVATSQQDYLRKISLKMVSMEAKSKNLDAASVSRNPQDPENGRT